VVVGENDRSQYTKHDQASGLLSSAAKGSMLPRAIGAAIAAAGSAAATGLASGLASPAIGFANAATGLPRAATGLVSGFDSAATGLARFATGLLRGFANAATGLPRAATGFANAAIGLAAAASGLGSCANTADARKRVLETIRSIPEETGVRYGVIKVILTDISVIIVSILHKRDLTSNKKIVAEQDNLKWRETQQ